MKVTILNDTTVNNGFKGEWGLSLYIEFKGKKILFDTGQTGLFIENMKQLNLSAEDIEFGVLSHAHYDHANGLKYFFKANALAPVYVGRDYGEYCYDEVVQENTLPKKTVLKYKGPEKGVLEKYKERIKFVSSCLRISEGIFLFPHIGLPQNEGKTLGRYVKKGDRLIPDSYSHEQSLILENSRGIIVIEGCSHAGIMNIIEGIRLAFPNKKIVALIGGFHQIDKTENQIEKLVSQLECSGIDHIITGHCTGDLACSLLQQRLKDRFQRLTVGSSFEFEE